MKNNLELGNRKLETGKPLIVIVGETGSGKSSLALRIAKEFGGEIITADSRTVYKGLDIGTAKPTKKQQSEIKHHGIDLVNPDERFSVAQFQKYAKTKISEIRERNLFPIIVGGTGLYVDSVLFNYSFEGSHDSEKRRALNNMSLEKLTKLAEKEGIEVTNEMLKNKRHLVGQIERGDTTSIRWEMPDNTLIIGLRLSRSSLRNNITKRVEAMFKAGLRKEIDTLKSQYGWDNGALSGIGYSEFKGWYDGEFSMTHVKKSIVQNTLKYAKRQRTWFKRNRFIEWFETADDAYERVKGYLETRN